MTLPGCGSLDPAVAATLSCVGAPLAPPAATVLDAGVDHVSTFRKMRVFAQEGDRVIGSRGSIRDVTARINAEREILRQKDLLDSLLQQSPIAMVINDMDKKISVGPITEVYLSLSQNKRCG